MGNFKGVAVVEKIYETEKGPIHYWINDHQELGPRGLVFLPGLTADHRLFETQLAYFKDRERVLVWDAPGHGRSYPFDLDFDLFDEAAWLDGILKDEGIASPILVGQSMGGYLGQVYSELFPEKLWGLVTIDSPPMQRRYYTKLELALLKKMEPIYRIYPWKALVRAGTKGVARTAYGQKLMGDMMRTYEGNQERYARLAGHGYRILAEAVDKDLAYKVACPQLVICGLEDRAGSCIRYLRAYEKTTGKKVQWIEGAGHNSNTDRPEEVNRLIEAFLKDPYSSM